MANTSTRMGVGPTSLFWLAALAYLLALRTYGFQVEDEGTLLLQFDRVVHGQVPYLDFHTGYTPAFFYAGAAIFRLLGRSVLALRTVLAVVNATSAAALYAVGRRLMGPWMAALAPLLWLALVPVYPGDFAAFNVPYPTWPATAAWLAVIAALLLWSRTNRPSLLAAAGIASAVVLAFRPNSGAFALAAATWVVCALARRASAIDHLAAATAAAFMTLGVWLTLDRRLIGIDACVHLIPTAIVAVCCAGPLSRRLAHREGTRTWLALSILAAAFLLPTAAWMLRFRTLLGTDTFLREVLLIGADYATLYYQGPPAPQVYAAAAVAAVLVVAVLGWLVRRRTVAPAPIAGLATAVVAVALVVVARRAVMPEGLRTSLLFQVENSLFWLAPLANVGALALLVRRWRQGTANGTDRTLLVVAAGAVAMYLQMYPRSDFMHEITAAPLSLVVGAALLDRVCKWWEQGRWPATIDARRAVRGALAVAVALLVGAKLSLTLAAPLSDLWTGRETETARFEPLPLRTERGAGDDLEALQRAAAYLSERTAPGEDVWTFPATSGVLFAADRLNPLRNDYWFPGRPDHAAEDAMVASLREHTPRYLVTLNSGWTFFTEAPAYFRHARRFAVDNYRLAGRFGRFDVLARKDVEAGGDLVRFEPVGNAAAAIEPQLARRRQAARRWMAGLTPAAAAVAELPDDPLSALLLLRALRDGGDIRAAGWLIAGYRSADPRIRHEATSAMKHLAAEFRARRLRWANDFSPARYAAFVRPYVPAARELAGFAQTSAFASAILSLAGAD